MEDFNDGVDGKLAFRMRKVNPEQFHTLVKMHLSFELDLNTEDNDCITEKAKEKKWSLLSFSKKPKSTISLQKGVEGASLTEDGIKQVKKLIDYLINEHCLIQEGIFRRTGKLTRQQDLKAALYQGNELDLEDGRFSVHDCASVLKSFLAELSEPLLTDLHYPAHCQIAEFCSIESSTNESRLLRSLQLLLLLLPPPNRIVLKNVLNLLHKTATFECKNKMNCDTLATLFTPHLLCPRKLSPEALHINSQNLSCLIAFMIKKGIEMFDVPPKLATDIRAYWVEQERKLLSPKKTDLNESAQDTTGTAHTVFSFVDHKLTAKANSTEDTQAALAQLYAHIQAMPESAKKRKLVKQFNKENGQGTPRQVKQYRTKSLGDSIKKHIFQKKILGQKKLMDINLGCNITRSSSEETILSTTLEKQSPMQTAFSKSEDELSLEQIDTSKSNNLLLTKAISISTGSLNNSLMKNYKENRNIMLTNFVKINEESLNEKTEKSKQENWSQNEDATCKINEKEVEVYSPKHLNDKYRPIRLTRQLSEPPDLYSSRSIFVKTNETEIVRQNSDPIFSITKKPNIEVVFTPKKSIKKPNVMKDFKREAGIGPACSNTSPLMRNKFRNVHAAHTSTPSSILRRNLVTNDYVLTPVTNSDNSMSPITQSATKMTKAMQETMMTPRSRKPVMMISGSNLCNLAAVKDGWTQQSTPCNLLSPTSEVHDYLNCISILEESPRPNSTDTDCSSLERVELENKENLQTKQCKERNFVTSLADDYCTLAQQSSMSITSTFREYLLSRSVLTASPVDLSFTSRTGDFEQSESDLNMLNEEELSESLLCCLDGNNPESDTSGVVSGSTNSANNSSEQINDMPSPRKRGTTLQRNDSKRSTATKNKIKARSPKSYGLQQKQLSESTLSSIKIKDGFQETSF
ncbi:uncharacterized protein RhoGAP54D [Prorops nasuta]|uniref:uncharacterized protein RhoGAP54D n=1 Tax=Prorops nasuta TaxID=863751 RepID=UPI0034CD8488